MVVQNVLQINNNKLALDNKTELDKLLDSAEPVFRFLATACSVIPTSHEFRRSMVESFKTNTSAESSLTSPAHPFSFFENDPSCLEYAYKYINDLKCDAYIPCGDNIYTDVGFYAVKVDEDVYRAPHTPFETEQINITVSGSDMLFDGQNKRLGLGKGIYTLNTTGNLVINNSNLKILQNGEEVLGQVTGTFQLQLLNNFSELVDVVLDETTYSQKIQFGIGVRITTTKQSRKEYSDNFIDTYFNNGNPYWGTNHPILGTKDENAFIVDTKNDVDETLIESELIYGNFAESVGSSFSEYTSDQIRSGFAITRSALNGWEGTDAVVTVSEVDGNQVETITLGTGESMFGGLTFSQLETLDEYKNLTDNEKTQYMDMPYQSTEDGAKKIVLGYPEYYEVEVLYKGYITDKLLKVFNNQIIKYSSFMREFRTINNKAPTKEYQKFKDDLKDKIYPCCDDHDVGPNNWGENYVGKFIAFRIIQEVDSFDNVPFLDYKDPNDPIAKNGTGLYYSKTFKIPLNDRNKSVTFSDVTPDNEVEILLLVLDDQTNRTPGQVFNKNTTVLGNEYLDPDKISYFGQTQIDWFRRELNSTNAALVLVTVGSPPAATNYGSDDSLYFNPIARTEFLSIISDIRPKGLVLLGGDAHETCIHRIEALEDLNYNIVQVGSLNHGNNSRYSTAETVYKVTQEDLYENNPVLKNLSAPWAQNCFVTLDLVVPEESNNVHNNAYLRVTNYNLQYGLNKITKSNSYYINLSEIQSYTVKHRLNTNLYLQTYENTEAIPSTVQILPTAVYKPVISATIVNTTDIQNSGINLQDAQLVLEIANSNYNLEKENGTNPLSINVNNKNSIILNTIARTGSVIVGGLDDINISNSKTFNDNFASLLPPVGVPATYRLLLVEGSKQYVVTEETKTLNLVVDGEIVMNFSNLPDTLITSSNTLVYNNFLIEGKTYTAPPGGWKIYNNGVEQVGDAYVLSTEGFSTIDPASDPWLDLGNSAGPRSTLTVTRPDGAVAPLNDNTLFLAYTQDTVLGLKDKALQRLPTVCVLDSDGKRIDFDNENPDKPLADYLAENPGSKLALLIKNYALAPYTQETLNDAKQNMYFVNTSFRRYHSYGLYSNLSDDWTNNSIQVSTTINYDGVPTNTDNYVVYEISLLLGGDFLVINSYLDTTGGYADYRLIVENQAAKLYDTGWAPQNAEILNALHPKDENNNYLQNYSVNVILHFNLNSGIIVLYAGAPDNEIKVAGTVSLNIPEFLQNYDITLDNLNIAVTNLSYKKPLGIEDGFCAESDMKITELIN